MILHDNFRNSIRKEAISWAVRYRPVLNLRRTILGVDIFPQARAK